MKFENTIQVRITGSQGKKTSGTVKHRIWQKKERTMRALKAFGTAWGLALVTLFIPLLHFILVPLFLIAGPIVFFWVAGQEEIILGGKGECPNCKEEFQIVRTPVKWPLTDLCNHCKSEVKIQPAH